MTAATFDVVRACIKETYIKIWGEWYYTIPNAVKAQVIVDLSDASAWYSHSHNQITIPVAEWNLCDADILNPEAWSIWKVDLIHEMLHEWQRKTPCTPTVEAEALHQKYGNASCEEGHGPDFYQAVIEKAAYFNLTAEELAKRI